MKKRIVIGSIIGGAMLIMSIGCQKDETAPVATTPTTIVPSSFNVDVPTSLTGAPTIAKSATVVPISGNEIYRIMQAFIYVGNESGKITRELMSSIAKWNINRPMSFAFNGDDDKRSKSFVVTANQSFEGKTFAYKMVIKDVLSDSVGLEMYWNRAPISGVAIIQGYNLDKTKIKDKQAKIRINYDEAKVGSVYEKEMEVTIVGLDTAGVENRCDNLKMFVGKKGDIVEVYGNANLPNHTIIDKSHKDGYNWAFVGKSNETINIAIAKVALPPCTLTDVTNIFDNYSIKSVLEGEVHDEYGLNTVAGQLFIDTYLQNTGSPAYFNGSQGFISCGTTVPTTTAGFTSDFVNLGTLKPYIPSAIDDLTLNFSE